MRVSFDFLNEPIEIKNGVANVLCIENKSLFRKVMQAFIDNNTEENKIIFSLNFKPFKAKGNVYILNNYFDLEFSSSFVKKIYDDISNFCVNDIQSETVRIKSAVNEFMEIIMRNYDFDFSCKTELELSELFKIMSLKPALFQNDLPSALLDFIFLIQKYMPQKCYVLFNIHSYFDDHEIEAFYKEILNTDIRILLVESNSFEKSSSENVRIVDKDFCEIVENG